MNSLWLPSFIPFNIISYFDKGQENIFLAVLAYLTFGWLGFIRPHNRKVNEINGIITVVPASVKVGGHLKG